MLFDIVQGFTFGNTCSRDFLTPLGIRPPANTLGTNKKV